VNTNRAVYFAVAVWFVVGILVGLVVPL